MGAAVAELSERGYDGFTMDGVAARAGTNKNAIYRRWTSRTRLALAAYRELVGRPSDPPDTGSLRGDVLQLLRDITARIGGRRSAEILAALFRDARQDPELMADLRAELAAGPQAMLDIVARAVARGEAAPTALRPRIYRLPITLLQAEYLSTGTAGPSDDTLIEIVDLVFLPLSRPER